MNPANFLYTMLKNQGIDDKYIELSSFQKAETYLNTQNFYIDSLFGGPLFCWHCKSKVKQYETKVINGFRICYWCQLKLLRKIGFYFSKIKLF
jgi:hypothetical protein